MPDLARDFQGVPQPAGGGLALLDAGRQQSAGRPWGRAPDSGVDESALHSHLRRRARGM